MVKKREFHMRHMDDGGDRLLTDHTRISDPDRQILTEIRFGYLRPYPVAGMGEPWHVKMKRTQRLLRAQGIGAILTLTEEDLYGNRHKAAGFSHHHEPIDDTQPPTSAGMDRAIAFINESLEQDKGVAVHCLEGRGRTGTILCAWIGIKESLPPKEAIIRVHELRWDTVLTPSQRSFLYRYLANITAPRPASRDG